MSRRKIITPEMQEARAEIKAERKAAKPCKHVFVFDASFMMRGPTKAVCKKCGHKETFGAHR